MRSHHLVTSIVTLAVTVGLPFWTTPAAAACTEITALPATLGSPGLYCVTQNLTLQGSAGLVAFTVTSNDVVLDLGGLTVNLNRGGLTGTFVGVQATDQARVTVQNGMIRQFDVGISITGNTVSNLIQNTRLTVAHGGVLVDGQSAVVRGNVVLRSGAPTLGPGGDSFVGIHTTAAYARVVGNDVTFPGGNNACGDGLGAGTGIQVDGVRSVVAGNRVVMQTDQGFMGCPADSGQPSGVSIWCAAQNSAAVDNTVIWGDIICGFEAGNHNLP